MKYLSHEKRDQDYFITVTECRREWTAFGCGTVWRECPDLSRCTAMKERELGKIWARLRIEETIPADVCDKYLGK